ncbi:MAG TPA: Rieske (2Fe-2S) protein [Kineosporiaceae bacterium]|nr:Rieske (2Fe-2S) protein [Kineosporiaceae bacterium]
MTFTTNDQDETVNPLSRRKVFTMCSLGLLGAAGLAACGSDSDADSAAASTETAETSAAATEAAADGAASLVALSDVPVAGAVSLEVAGKPVIISQPTEGEVIGFSAVCPHQFATVAVSGKELRCPLHASTFDMATGKNLSGPAAGKPLPAFAVKVVDGEVVQA